jgi:hypothetical protein
MVGPPGTNLPGTQLPLMQIVAHALDLSDDIVLVMQPDSTAGLVMGVDFVAGLAAEAA